MSTNQYNLVEEAWIPIIGHEKVSLRSIFSDQSLQAIGGNPIEKIALLKLFLAIAQAAWTPKDDQEWEKMTLEEFSSKCLKYLSTWKHAFYLYGDTPFLQMPSITPAELKPYAAISPEVAMGNKTVLTQFSVERPYNDAQRALLLLCQMGFAFGGKKADNTCILTPSYQLKTKSAKVGSSLLKQGLLHSFYTGQSIIETIFFNILTMKNIRDLKVFDEGVGIAPWEQMPSGEDCTVARRLKNSLIGRLIPLGRFCLLRENDLHYTEGILHPDYNDGVIDPTASGDFSAKTPKIYWVQPERRPWRILTSLLNFLDASNASVSCSQLSYTYPRIRKKTSDFSLWSGGISVSNKAGEYYVSANNDYVESSLKLSTNFMSTHAFTLFSKEILDLDLLTKILFSAISNYHAKLNIGEATRKKIAQKAVTQFWEMAEQKAQKLILACCEDNDSLDTLRGQFARLARIVYDKKCPFSSARQLNAYSLSKPQFNKYLNRK